MSKGKQSSTFWKPGETGPPSSLKEERTSNLQIKDANKTAAPASLSNSVLSMKFMKRKVEAEMQRKVETEKKIKLLDPQWSLAADSMEFDMPSSTNSSFVHENENDFFSIYSGRRSFRSFNNQVEKYCAELADDQRFERAVSSKESLTDEEMAQRYANLAGLPRGPSQGKRKLVSSKSSIPSNRNKI
jgi:hypothetical protein